jgi:hypothetical protein
MSRLFARSSSQRRLYCGWMSVRMVSETIFFYSGLAINKELYISKCLPVFFISYKFIQKQHKKEKNRILTWFGVGTLRKGYVGPIRRAKNWINSKGRKYTKRRKERLTATNYPPKYETYLMANIRKELKLKLTGIRKAMKELPAQGPKGPQVGCIFCCK